MGRFAQWQATRLRRHYAGGRGDAFARLAARFYAALHGTWLTPRRWVTLEVPGRRTGNLTRFPLGMADVDGHWYLVSMLGECAWVWNVRAADGHAVLRHGRARPVRLVEVPVEERAPMIRRLVQVAPGARPHVRVDRAEPVAAFEAVAADHPVFRVLPATP
ncbi:nitroreductase/quinone reductase family protein [Cellulomonas wangsupingiae]|uniref:Nitroreductase family deazaflavin-dependent oxidoreductase n=1 Tax=Cellulomonas wangsupingiae TaxID=2968085 RepID=A0ABY5K516_9CELL|nr:nitroreductase/quinone reductase family protein [Cellulomonas wangsupingiae]MCC2336134.1 nitroreductase family deazaflavin-dependent oxidoreductase [Cellulomonas wangsupingiae]MCM0639554.1 nitroreductase family deazaflavin-dependent oxidoreductase [Cellulomonas wangsupingiae]UUI64854.1 nitroreductase family deazaflavin-dependent oxidoreductase [Cellulomonas wangsupingiae]